VPDGDMRSKVDGIVRAVHVPPAARKTSRNLRSICYLAISQCFRASKAVPTMIVDLGVSKELSYQSRYEEQKNIRWDVDVYTRKRKTS
jgi:hypothetical protein